MWDNIPVMVDRHGAVECESIFVVHPQCESIFVVHPHYRTARQLPHDVTFLSNRDVTFVGIWKSMDKILLEVSPYHLEISRFVDLCHLRNMPNATMEKMAMNVLGIAVADERAEWVGHP
ncbi:hypothetical protein BUALT_Bualt12G0076300 [Buddleja alternifolia]|uniref:Uncharacterized protein n=1 Tax=Buddleja alternifolia TaxID=168488 RepID=A0AAV6WNF3_9LAMI|nr:hypothetical protein BUALT_Bualt12G0076300 [Buddleja alternifolia]